MARDAEARENPPKPRWRRSCEQLHDYVLFMANTGLRPDEAARLQFRDVTIVEDDATNERILEIEVRGKRGTGYCKSMPGAVLPFERLRNRPVRRRGRGGGRAALRAHRNVRRTLRRCRSQPTCSST